MPSFLAASGLASVAADITWTFIQKLLVSGLETKIGIFTPPGVQRPIRIRRCDFLLPFLARVRSVALRAADT